MPRPPALARTHRLRHPPLHRRHVHLHVNGVRRGTIYDDVQQPGRDTVGEWFSDDDQGSLWKTDCWNEFDDAGNRIDPCVLNTLQRFPSSGPPKIARYRWNWRPRAVHGSANDFSDLLDLVEAVNSTSNYLGAVERAIDLSATLAIGDGSNDIPMLKIAGLGIAFEGKPKVKQEIPVWLDYAGPTGLLYLQGYRRDEFVER